MWRKAAWTITIPMTCAFCRIGSSRSPLPSRATSGASALRPVFYFGQYYAESLIFAESGQQVGAIQIAGTIQTTQIPFFIAACDYVIIGDEFYAASAYLSREPSLLGSIVGQDVIKAILMIFIVIGTLLVTVLGPAAPLFQSFVKFLTS